MTRAVLSPASTLALLPSRRAARVAPFLAMDVMAAAAAREARGDGVVHMEVGQPSAPAPRAVIAAAQAALAGGALPYTQALGLPALRTRIARHYADTHGVDVAPGRVVVTTGSSAGFILAFLGLFDAGARIAVPQPGYPAYRSILHALDLVPAPLPLTDADRYAPTSEGLRALHAKDPLSGVLVMSPANPSGTVIAPERLADLCATARALDLRFISDEIYHGLTFVGEETTALAVSDDAVVINSFSKYYCMTGWRIGWMVLPEDKVRGFERIAQSLYISPPELSQIAAEAALGASEELEVYKESYAANRALLLRRLPELGFTIASPMDGAFYAYVDAGRFTNDSMAFAHRMLAEIDVAATPGRDFDPLEGHRAMRFSYAGAPAEIATALDRMAGWLKT